MADRLYETNWQRIPFELQKYLVIIIADMQIPLYYHGFSFIDVNLETFQQVTLKKKIDSLIAQLGQNYDFSY